MELMVPNTEPIFPCVVFIVLNRGVIEPSTELRALLELIVLHI